MTQTIGFIGSGMIGGALARLAVAAGLNVVMSNSRGPETLADLVAELGEHARAATPEEAAKAGDVVVATVPLGVYAKLPADALAGRTVIDTMNYYPGRDGRIAELDGGDITSSELLQRHLTGSRVVKTLHNMDWIRLYSRARPAGAPDRSALPVAGDDPAAKAEMVRLLDVLGYDAVDIGTLADSWRCEPGTPVYVQPYQGPRPAQITQQDWHQPEWQRWFREAPGEPVPADRVKQLIAQAVRGHVGGHSG
ncbi:putative dinucleotide-binding enzyme [Streptomyces sp. LBL]|uniref:NADPH-dependent F420 reductase n=1 Tax=Streptomyces sp. LBL TaxID=2940562 RepID=UPI002476DF6A|nr:NADPH-dependent F420 reductase [Streptomyces sp. LBL]MDH6622728.1 putative dinucleotide-binding enzyme [Streptomyces sp. LBL]